MLLGIAAPYWVRCVKHALAAAAGKASTRIHNIR